MDTLPEAIRRRCERPVAVFGLGVSGRAVVSCLKSYGVACVVYDEGAKDEFGVRRIFFEAEARQHDLVVYSPGFTQSHPWLDLARRCGALCLGEMDFASLFWHGMLVAVTGTNGKTTLTEFLAAALRRCAMEAVAVGNIGRPLSFLPESARSRAALAVCEISSFQAEDLKFLRPQAVLWTNFEEDHLDRYANMREYFDAKFNLVRRLRRPRLIVGEQVAQWAQKLGYELPAYTKVITRQRAQEWISPKSYFTTYPQQENYLIAREYWQSEQLPLRMLEKTAENFTGRKHRLAPVAEIDGVTYWNDSKGTNFHAVLAALRSFDEPVIWIGGGKSKGGDLETFVRQIAPKIRVALLTGQTAAALEKYFKKVNKPVQVFDSLDGAVKAAHETARAPEQVLFSPGFSSFDAYTDYAERGLHFESCVLGLKQT